MSDKGWSDGGQIYYTGGYAWGVLSNLKTVCLGTEEKIQNKENPKNNPVLENIFRLEKASA